MKRFLSLVLVACTLHCSAQENVGGLPYSFRHAPLGGAPSTVVASPFDASAVAANDAERERAGELPLYARFRTVERGLHNAGAWTELPNGDRVWRLRVESPGALATELFFANFHLPPGGIMHVYNDDGSHVLGGFTTYNNHPSGLFTTEGINGDASIIEYFEPLAVRGQGSFTISHVGHAYRFVGGTKADACEVDVVCVPEGSGWSEERDGVVRISVVSSLGTGWCSGSLVNNTAQDCKPYFLTAFHCGETSTTANFNQYKFYFRYQRSGCASGTALANKVMTGCARRADSNCGGGDNGSDFLLVEANNNVPANFFPYFNGWDASGTGSNSGVGIHHPSGDEKKISTYTGALVSATWWNANGAHWRVFWTATTNGWGVTEPGSSGSPIFNASGRIVGTLTGGGSCCTVNGCGNGTGPTVQDLYGKMSYHWGSQNPNPANEELHVWLDPGNSVDVLDGSSNPCGIYSVQEESLEAPGLYPNPATNSVTVVFPNASARAELLIVVDMAGRVVLDPVSVATGKAEINVSGLANGAYLVKLMADGVAYAAAPLHVAH